MKQKEGHVNPQSYTQAQEKSEQDRHQPLADSTTSQLVILAMLLKIISWK